mgnify:CR=1 FL=1
MRSQLDTFNQYLAEKEKKIDEREEKGILALQEMNELEKTWLWEQKTRTGDEKGRTHDIDYGNFSFGNSDESVLHNAKNEIFAKWSSNVSSPNFYFPLPPDE